MMLRSFACFVLVALLGVAAVSSAAPPQLRWPALPGFRSETIPFPLEFARDIVLHGVEEIRFAPGWGDPKAPDYFTYAFIWQLEPPNRLDAPVLKSQLRSYFHGLMADTARSKQLNPEAFPTYVRVDPGRPPRNEPTFPVRPTFHATVQTWDAFHGGNRLTLDIDVFEPKSPIANTRLYYFEASPHLDDPKVHDEFVKARRQLEL